MEVVQDLLAFLLAVSLRGGEGDSDCQLAWLDYWVISVLKDPDPLDGRSRKSGLDLVFDQLLQVIERCLLHRTAPLATPVIRVTPVTRAVDWVCGLPALTSELSR